MSRAPAGRYNSPWIALRTVDVPSDEIIAAALDGELPAEGLHKIVSGIVGTSWRAKAKSKGKLESIGREWWNDVGRRVQYHAASATLQKRLNDSQIAFVVDIRVKRSDVARIWGVERIKGDAPQLAVSNEPPATVHKSFPAGTVQKWIEGRIREHVAGTLRPTQLGALAECRAKLEINVSRDPFIEVWQRIVPRDWLKTGRRPKFAADFRGAIRG
jgi:hypothetical protein